MARPRWFTPARGLLVLVILLVTGLIISGCLPGGTRPLGWSGVAVSGDRLFFGSSDGSLISLITENGNPDWQESLAGEAAGGLSCIGGGSSVGLYGLPVSDGEVIYATGYNGRVYAIKVDGESRWQYPREDDAALGAITGGVALAGDKLFFGSFDGNVYALNTATGDLQWQFATGNRIWATPVVVDGQLFVGSFDSMLYALDAESGSQLWAFDAGGAIASTALVDDGTVYFGTLDRTFLALDAASGQELWRYTGDDGGGPQNWFWARPLIYGGAIFAPNLDGFVYILDAASGQKLKEFDLGSPAAAAPALVGSMVIVASDDGKVYVIDGDDKDIRLLTDLGLKLVAPITAGDGVVYVHTQEDEKVYALDPEARVVVWSFTVQ